MRTKSMQYACTGLHHLDMDEALLKAQLDFQPVPPAERRTPGRIKSVPARLRVDEFFEHEEAFEFLKEASQDTHGEGSKTLVRALLHFRDTVTRPLEEKPDPELLLIARGEFQTKPKTRSQKVKNVSARLYIDKFLEHREAYQFLSEMQSTHGEGNKTIIRALLHYRDTVYKELKKKRSRKNR